ncbi:metal-dependent hydrolase [Candidatus Altiarchaeota archaeon]
MDLLLHFLMSLIACVIINQSLRLNFRFRILFLYSLISILIDLDHLLLYVGFSIMEVGINTSVLHSVFFLFLVPLVIFLLLRNFSSTSKWKAAVIAMIFWVMWVGHFLFDMIYGRYGIPLLYPLSNKLFTIPSSLEISLQTEFVHPLNSQASIALLLYLIAIWGVIKIGEKLSPNNGWAEKNN